MRMLPSAADRYRFLKLAFGVILVLPWIPFPWASIFATTTSPGPSSLLATAAIRIQPVTDTQHSIAGWVPSILLALYFAAVVLFFARVLLSIIKLHRLHQRSVVVCIRNGIKICAVDAAIPPATFGLFRPIIIVPNAIKHQVSDDQLEMILQHEEHHIDRRDYLFNLIKTAVQGLLVFSPFIHRLARAFVEEMELSCDALVIHQGGHRAKDYGGLLLQLTATTSPRKDLVYSGLFVTNAFISRRIIAMKNVQAGSRQLLTAAVFATFALFIGPAVASLGVENALKNVTESTNSAGQMAYKIELIQPHNKQNLASGTLALVSGKTQELNINDARVQITPQSVAKNWKFTVEIYKAASQKLVSRAVIITTAQEGAHLYAGSGPSKGASLDGYSITLTPITKTAAQTTRRGSDQENAMVRLEFKDPTEIKNIIKTMAQVSGKNIVLSHDVTGKVLVYSDHPVPKKEAYQAFIAALNKIDLVAVDEGKAIRIMHKPR